jgi:hypothetical protein
LKKYTVALLFLSIALMFASNHRDDVLLFCLTPDTPVIQILNDSGPIEISHPELQGILLKNGAISIEKWLPSAMDTDNDGDIYLNRIYRVKFSMDDGKNLDVRKFALLKMPIIHSVEFEQFRYPTYTPNDPRYNQQWFLPQVGANIAWEYWDISGGDLPGDQSVILASVDTGVDWDHQDIIGNVWQNLNEDFDGDGHTIEFIDGEWVLDPGDLNNIDDDDWDNNPNTYVDDLIGWDVSGESGVDDNNPIPKLGVNNYSTWAHGTHVAGLLGATTNNNTGIASTAFNCSIMSVKVSTDEQLGQPYITDGYAGILYAAQAGFNYAGISIQNNSWGGIGYNQYEQATINVAHDDYNAIIVAAAGNGNDYGAQEYATHYPSSYENVISVCPTGTNDAWHGWATYHETIDLASPGENIHSTVINDNYSSWMGSSMASPIAASSIGLMMSYYPERTQEQLERMILETADPVIYDVNTAPYLVGRIGRGRVDALKAVETPLFPIIELAAIDLIPLDDNDGEVNGGDIYGMMTIIFSDPEWGTAVNVQGSLSTESPYVTILSGSSNYSDLAPGDIGLNDAAPFEFALSTNIPEGITNLTLTITSNENDYVVYHEDIPIELDVVASPYLYGDLNQDTIIDVLDIVILVSIIIGSEDPTEYQEQVADMNNDGVIDVLDIVILVDIITG